MKYRKELLMAIMALAATGEKPDKKVAMDLVKTLADLSRDGNISQREVDTLKHHLKKALKSAKVSNQEIQQLEKLTEQAASEAGLDAEKKKALVSRMSAVARSVQAKQAKK